MSVRSTEQGAEPIVGTLQLSVFPSPGVGDFGLRAMGVVVIDDVTVGGVGVVASVEGRREGGRKGGSGKG